MVEPKQASSGTAATKRRTKVIPEPETSAPALAEIEGTEEEIPEAEDSETPAPEAKLTRHWRTEFLAALAETSNVSAASAAARVSPSRPYRVRRDEPDFAREWRTALLEGYENLELEVLHRLRFGEAKDGDLKFDNAGALRLLGLHRDTVARERAMRENEDLGTVRSSIDTKLEQLRRQVAARREAEREAGPSDHG